MLAAWMLMATGTQGLPPRLALLAREGGQERLWILAKEKREVAGGGTPVAWSPTGQHLVISSGGKLAYVSLEGKPTPTALTYFGGWDPTGRWFVGGGPDGVFRVEVGGTSTKLLPTAQLPSLSPDGTRLAFARADGLWVASADGRSPHRILAKPVPEAIRWSPDSRSLALIAAKQLYRVRPDGSQLQKLGAVEGLTLAWSPGGGRLLTRMAGGLRLVGLDGVATAELPGVVAATWTGNRKLLGLKGQLQSLEIKAKESESTPLEKPVSGEIVAMAAYSGLQLEGRERDPFDQAPNPSAGQTRLRGVVEDVDPGENSLTLRVDSQMDGQGRELNYAQPVTRMVIVPGRNLARVKPESEVMVYLEGATFVRLLTEAGASGPSASRAPRTNIEYDGVTMDRVVVPIIFPVVGKVRLSDTFLAPRGGGTRRHHGQDLMGPRMMPLVATFDGVVSYRVADRGNAGYMLSLTSDDGFRAVYIHLNNDLPGTDDGQGGPRYAFAPGLRSGDRVVAGQFLGWLGDSGNAETTAPHLHFELHDQVAGGILNAYPSLTEAEKIPAPVYPMPAPDLKPGSGEVRYDGVVTAVEGNQVRLDLIATISTKTEVCVMPTELRITVPDEIPVRSDPNRKLAPSDLRPGFGITILGKRENGNLRGRVYADLR